MVKPVGPTIPNDELAFICVATEPRGVNGFTSTEPNWNCGGSGDAFAHVIPDEAVADPKFGPKAENGVVEATTGDITGTAGVAIIGSSTSSWRSAGGAAGCGGLPTSGARGISGQY